MFRFALTLAALWLLGTSGAARAQVTSLPSETPADFKPATDSFDSNASWHAARRARSTRLGRGTMAAPRSSFSGKSLPRTANGSNALSASGALRDW